MTQNIHARFFSWAIEHERRMKSRRSKRNTIIKPGLAELEKEIPPKKTGLAAGNNFLIDDVPKRSVRAANRHPNSYLAINWQRTDVEARFTSRGRRFPTPQPTTRHMFWPNQRRKAAFLLPIWLRNSGFLSRRYDQKVERGAGGRHRKPSGDPRPKRAHGIFCLMDPAPCSAASKKERSRRKRRRPTPTSAPVVSTVP
jgi:hypothetical protein